MYANVFTQNDRTRTLAIGQRQRSFPGMLARRQFTVVLPDGIARTIAYDGTAQEVLM